MRLRAAVPTALHCQIWHSSYNGCSRQTWYGAERLRLWRNCTFRRDLAKLRCLIEEHGLLLTGRTLSHAAASGCVEMVAWLIEQGCRLPTRPCLIWPAEAHQIAMVQCLQHRLRPAEMAKCIRRRCLSVKLDDNATSLLNSHLCSKTASHGFRRVCGSILIVTDRP